MTKSRIRLLILRVSIAGTLLKLPSRRNERCSSRCNGASRKMASLLRGWHAVKTIDGMTATKRTTNVLCLRSLSIGLVVAFSSFVAAQSVDNDLVSLFDDSIQPLTVAEDLPSWSQTLQRIEQQQEELEQCISDETMCEGRLESIHHLLGRGDELSREQSLQLVNRSFFTLPK